MIDLGSGYRSSASKTLPVCSVCHCFLCFLSAGVCLAGSIVRTSADVGEPLMWFPRCNLVIWGIDAGFVLSHSYTLYICAGGVAGGGGDT